MTTHADDATLQANVQEVLPGLRRDLEDLVRIQSVSADPERAAEVQRSAEAVRDLFAAEGFDARIVTAHDDGVAPAVIAHKASKIEGADGAALRPPRRATRERPCRVGFAAVGADRPA
jgi:acetylornithine deacetylase/succinyl-diaminopimelate desuccinylase-like protein